MQKILIVDDEKDIVSFLRAYFKNEGFSVITAHSGISALKAIHEQPDIILLDINMPELNGLDTCKSLREITNAPILFLTARIQDHEKIEGLAIGADDYLVKPFNIDVLGAKVRSHLRREDRNSDSREKEFWQSDGNIAVNYRSRQVKVNNLPITFSKTEFDMIALLLKHKGQVFDKERIYELIWGYYAEGDSNTVTEYVKRIRHKFTKQAIESPIETVWGVGYKWKN